MVQPHVMLPAYGTVPYIAAMPFQWPSVHGWLWMGT
jgi:hypothetical protein